MPKKVLIADDDPVVVKLVEKFLKEKGFEVIIAQNGLDAILLTKQKLPDLLVLDVMMPEINGYDVCFQLKFDDKYKHIPVIILTVREKELNDAIAQKAGIAYFKKPVEPEMFLSLVNRMLA